MLFHPLSCARSLIEERRASIGFLRASPVSDTDVYYTNERPGRMGANFLSECESENPVWRIIGRKERTSASARDISIISNNKRLPSINQASEFRCPSFSSAVGIGYSIRSPRGGIRLYLLFPATPTPSFLLSSFFLRPFPSPHPSK